MTAQFGDCDLQTYIVQCILIRCPRHLKINYYIVFMLYSSILHSVIMPVHVCMCAWVAHVCL